MLISDSLRAPTSFAVQARLLVDGFIERGHEVVSVGATHMPLDDQPEGLREYTAQGMDLKQLSAIALSEQPDVVIAFNHTSALNLISHVKGIAPNCPMFYWLPWEGSTLPPNAHEMWKELPTDAVVHLTEYGKDMWKDTIRSDLTIPHGVDFDIFNTNKGNVTELRRKWSKRFGFPILRDGLVLLNVDRNDLRKRWDLTFDLLRRVQKKYAALDVQLIAHTFETDRKPSVGGFDLHRMAKVYGLEGSVIFTKCNQPMDGLTREELAELYYLSNFYVSTTMGEGFGIPALESMACGTPAIVPDHTALSEVLNGYSGLVKPAASCFNMGTVWQVPDVEAMANKVVDARNSYTDIRQEGIDLVTSKYDAQSVVRKWEEVLHKAVTEDYHGWYLNRWGHSSQWQTYGILHAAAMVVKYMGEKSLEIGSFTGKFLEFAKAEGVDIVGLEPDLKAINLCSPQADACTKHLPYAATWPDATLVVLTDVLDLIHASGDGGQGTEALTAFFNRLQSKNFVVARWGTTSRWDLSEVSHDLPRDVMENQLGFTRRFDLENIGVKRFPMFDHEIWQNGNISKEYIPPYFSELTK